MRGLPSFTRPRLAARAITLILSVLAVLLRAVITQRLCRRSTGEGRIAAFEIMLQTWAISHMIRENKIHQITGHLQSAKPGTSGMQSMDSSLYQYIKDGLITLQEGLKVAHLPEQLVKRCQDLEEL